MKCKIQAIRTSGLYLESNLTKPNLLIAIKLLVFHAHLIHYFYNSKNKFERPKRTSDSDSTFRNRFRLSVPRT